VTEKKRLKMSLTFGFFREKNPGRTAEEKFSPSLPQLFLSFLFTYFYFVT
jgi:hypothetical protein